MARNLELKVAVSPEGLQEVLNRARALGPRSEVQLRHTDTYFQANRGRLKLREIEETGSTPQAELIGYLRADETGSRWSTYHRAEVAALDQAASLVAALSSTLGVDVIVAKTRTVVIVERTRIHLDHVDGLGAFIELETVAGTDDLDVDIEREHASIIQQLGLATLPVIAGSYSDLIRERHNDGAEGQH